MCGIYSRICFDSQCKVGHKEFSPDSRLSRRGPDSHMIVRRPGVFISFFRLAIQDLGFGAQPFQFDDNFSAINGELYNKEELLGLLEFSRDASEIGDMQVLALAIAKLGQEALKLARGQFAGLIVFEDAKKVLLFRDRLGEKPLYYAIVNNHLFISSLALFSEADVMMEPKPIDLILGYTEFDQANIITEVPPGSIIEVNLSSSKQVKSHYFDWAETSPRSLGPVTITKGLFAEVFEEAVSESLVSDVPVSFLFSGGLDSTAVVLAASRVGADRMIGYTLSFGHTKFDETYFAKQIAKEVGLDLRVVDVDYEEIAYLMPKILDAMDIPIYDTSVLSLYALCKQVGNAFKVALSGDGGDELFRGYSIHKHQKRIEYLLALLRSKPASLPALRMVSRLLPAKGYNNAGFKIERFESTLLGLNYGFGIKLALSPLSGTPLLPILLKRVDNLALADDLEKFDLSSIDSHYRFNIFPKVYLLKSDRMSMANGVEIRTPMLSPKLIELSQILYSNDSKRLGKKELLDYCRTAIPSYLLNRPKHGFSFPVSRLLRHLPEPEWSIPFLNSDLDTVKSVWLRAKAGHINSGIAVWSLIVLNHFFSNAKS